MTPALDTTRVEPATTLGICAGLSRMWAVAVYGLEDGVYVVTDRFERVAEFDHYSHAQQARDEALRLSAWSA